MSWFPSTSARRNSRSPSRSAASKTFRYAMRAQDGRACSCERSAQGSPMTMRTIDSKTPSQEFVDLSTGRAYHTLPRLPVQPFRHIPGWEGRHDIIISARPPPWSSRKAFGIPEFRTPLTPQCLRHLLASCRTTACPQPASSPVAAAPCPSPSAHSTGTRTRHSSGEGASC